MLGLKSEIRIKKLRKFSEQEKRKIVEDYLQSGLPKRSIWEKYTGHPTEHGKILEWMRTYGYKSKPKEKRVIFVSQKTAMKEGAKDQSQSDFEAVQMQKRISDLEKQLSESEMKGLAWETMVELAEKEFNISIKKKFNIKPSKK
jgi:transposase-like protein